MWNSILIFKPLCFQEIFFKQYYVLAIILWMFHKYPFIKNRCIQGCLYKIGLWQYRSKQQRKLRPLLSFPVKITILGDAYIFFLPWLSRYRGSPSHADFETKKNALREIRVSGTVLKTQLTPNSPHLRVHKLKPRKWGTILVIFA